MTQQPPLAMTMCAQSTRTLPPKYFLRILFCMALLVTALAAPTCAWSKETNTRNPVWAEPVTLPGSDNFFRVTPDLYRAAQPSAVALQAFERFGIVSVLNLRAFHDDHKEAKGTKLVLLRVPINTWAVDDEHVIQVLALMRTAPKPLLVHCQHGADRTGLMFAMYRMVEQGWSKEAATDEMLNGGFGFHSVWKNILEYIEDVDIAAIRAHVDALAPPVPAK